MGTTTIDFYERTSRSFGERVRAVGDDQWQLPTPCAEWSVRVLVNHLTTEAMWTVPLLGGATLDDVGDRFDGDVLGDDPRGTFVEAAHAAMAAVTEAALDMTVHLSYGDVPAARYVTELTLDFLVHGWDLAKGIGADPSMDPEISATLYQALLPFEPVLRASGVFGELVETPDDADVATRLLGLLGRRADWTAPG
jgi:uncharacterized protein (TIGR03086 family)